MKQFEDVLRLIPCYGLRPWQLLGVDPQVALASPDIGAGAGSNCCPNIGPWQGTKLRYHFEVAIPRIQGALDPN